MIGNKVRDCPFEDERVMEGRKRLDDIPITIGGHHVVDAQLLANLLDTEMQRVGLELLAGHGRENGGRKAHEASRLVLRRVAPAVALLATARPVGFASRFRIAASFELALFRASGDAIVAVLASEAARLAERDVVGAGDALTSPRHFGGLCDGILKAEWRK